MRKNSIKNTRINSQVQRVLAEVIRGEIKDPRIHLMTSVIDVFVAPDLKTCKVWISVLGSQKEKEDTLLGLNNAKGFIKNKIAKELNMRNTPHIEFILDTSIEYGATMSKMIDDISKKESE